MAAKIHTDHKADRGDVFLLHPDDIEAVQGDNGRAEPHDEASVRELALEFVDPTIGQLQPVQVRRVAGNKAKLTFGFRRHAAAVLINREKLGGFTPSKPFKLKAILSDCNEEEAFLRNLTENNRRKALTPMDHAIAHRRLRDQYGWTNKRIAEFYQRSTAWVNQIAQLLRLPGEAQELVASSRLTVDAALDIAKLPETEQKEAMKAAAKEGGGIDSDAIRERARVARQKQGGGVKRTMKEVRAAFRELREYEYKDKQLGARVLDFADTVEGFLSGTRTKTQLHNAVDKLLGL